MYALKELSSRNSQPGSQKIGNLAARQQQLSQDGRQGVGLGENGIAILKLGKGSLQTKGEASTEIGLV